MSSRTPRRIVAGLLVASLFGTAACSDDKKDDAADKISAADAEAVATSYADLVSANYADVITKATEMQTAIAAFVANPSADGLEAAKTAWKAARVLYGPTEVFRFYEGPIDNAETGLEGQINSWPLDENYIDYVAEDADAGIINDVAGYPEITTDVLVEANTKGGEENISTGWHAIEFLLWGQDTTDGPGAGQRAFTDYTTAPNAARRGTYVNLLSDLLVKDLTTTADAWKDGAGSYRESFLKDPNQAITDILRGMGALSKAELAGERISVALDSKDREDEHSCFSDNTTVDVAGNAAGIRMVYTGEYTKLDGTKVGGTSLHAAVAKVAPEADQALMDDLDATTTLANKINAGGVVFDQLILDDATGRPDLQSLVTQLQAQGDEVAKLAGDLGYNVSTVVE